MTKLLKSVEKLLRLKNHNVEQVRQQVALLQSQIEARYKVIDSNLRYINTERLIATVNVSGASSLDAFVYKKTKENEGYEKEINDLKKTLHEVEENLFEIYKEVKQLEKVKEKEEIKVDEQRKMAETKYLDDIASQKSFFKLMNLIS